MLVKFDDEGCIFGQVNTWGILRGRLERGFLYMS